MLSEIWVSYSCKRSGRARSRGNQGKEPGKYLLSGNNFCLLLINKRVSCKLWLCLQTASEDITQKGKNNNINYYDCIKLNMEVTHSLNKTSNWQVPLEFTKTNLTGNNMRMTCRVVKTNGFHGTIQSLLYYCIFQFVDEWIHLENNMWLTLSVTLTWSRNKFISWFYWKTPKLYKEVHFFILVWMIYFKNLLITRWQICHSQYEIV